MRARTLFVGLAALVALTPAFALEPDRDFSGKWIFDATSSNIRNIPSPKTRVLSIAAQENAINFTSDVAPGPWKFSLDGKSTRYKIGEESYNSQTKWEGSALLVNTIVSGPQDYSLLDRWTLSRDRNVIVIERQMNQKGNESEGVLYFRREGTASPVISKSSSNSARVPAAPAPSEPLLTRPQAPPPASADIVVHAGTRIPLILRNSIDSKHSHEGDRVYLDTAYPIVVDNKIVIPRGSYVVGTLTTAKAGGTLKGKGELFIRFDSLTLPNGTTRDFRSRLASAAEAHGKVDPKEGTITGERDKSGAAKGGAEGGAIGAGIGGIAGAAAGHPLAGVGIGAAAGAAAGLATVFGKHKPDAALRKGATVEMLLDRDLTYQPEELARR